MKKTSPPNSLRVALINPTLPPQSVFEQLGRSDLPPLGLLYLAAALEREGHVVRVYDLNLDSHRAGIVDDVAAWSPDLVGLSTMAPAFDTTNDLAHTMRQRLGDAVKIVAGGADATIRPGAYLDHGGFDAVFVGEAEETLVTACRQWPDFSAAVGIATKDESVAVHPRKIDPDSAPFPARHLLPLKEYRGGPAYKRRRFSTGIFTHRGCPYECRFCEKAVHDGPIRFRSAESILEEVRRIRRDHDIHDLRFIDDVLMCNRVVLRRFIALIRESDERFDWLCTGRVDLMEESLLREMKSAGCYRIEIGVESGDDEVLAAMDKKLSTRQALEAVATARRVGVEIVANFILGLPGESRPAMRRTLDFAVRLDVDFAIFFMFTPFQGAEISRCHNLKFDPSYPGCRAPSPAYKVPTSEVTALIDEGYGRVYFRAGYIWRRLMAIRSGWIILDLARMALSHLWHRLFARGGRTATYRTGG